MFSKLITSGKLSIKMKLILILSLILISGLLLSNYFNYKAAQRSVRENLVNGLLPLERDNIYHEIQEQFIKPVLLPASKMKYPGRNLSGNTVPVIKKEQITALLKSYQDRYGSTVYLVNPSGIVQAHPNEKLAEQADISKLKGLKDIAAKILSSGRESSIHEFKRNREHILLSVRYIPEVRLFLFVEINENSKMSGIMKSIVLNLLFGIITTLIVIGISIFFINHYQGQLEYMAVTDALTGASNRREFDIQFRKAVYNFNRNGIPFSIIIFDIDHFKNVNDTMGHITGDSSIKTVAAIARRGMRLTDVLVRWGGDEFIIISYGDEESAMFIAERIRKEVEKSNFFHKCDYENNSFDMTISCGISGFRKGDTLDSILARADAALYKAKTEGRNRIFKG